MAFIRIAENINIMSKVIGPAMKERNAKPIQEMAEKAAATGVDYLDVNIGPAKKDGPEFMTWLVNIIQEVTDIPLSLDTTNMEATEAGLKAVKRPALINSISLQSSRMDLGLRIAKKYGANFIALLWSDSGMPRDANERAMHVVDFAQKVSDMGIPPEKMWIDPIVTPVSVEINQVRACVELMGMLKDIAPGAKSIVGLSNVSNGIQHELRTWLNIPYLIMLMKNGLEAAIVDAFDSILTDVVSGKKDIIVKLVGRIMDGESVDMSKLNDEELKYAKSTRVLMGDSLFSPSWLDV